MSEKRKISVLFLVIANVIMTVHAFIPHHHHNHFSLLEYYTHCDCNHIAISHHESQPEGLAHEHANHEDDEAYCSMGSYFIGSHSESYDKIVVLPTFQPLHCNLYQQELTHIKIPENRCLKKPYLLHDYEAIIASVGGLRAPPV
ncbi:MAG: hypothetical protein LBR18_00425 [Tannerella sp.]|jgi:hypothetical protein|nr:hypothetical protein [Tannerella sp.]